MVTQISPISKPRNKPVNIRWDEKTSKKVVDEYHRLRTEEKLSVKESFEQCQSVIQEDLWKTLGSLQNYFYANKLQCIPSAVGAVPGSKQAAQPTIAVIPGKPLPVLPIRVVSPGEDRSPIPRNGNSVEVAIAEFIKTELSTILAPVREAAKKFQEELEIQTLELQKPGGAIRFFARSLAEEEFDSTELPTTPCEAVGISVLKDPLQHTVGIIGLLEGQQTVIKNKFRGSKLYLRFVSKDNIRQAVNSVKNMSHIIVFSTKISHPLTNTLNSRGLKEKVIYISGITSLEGALKEIEKKVKLNLEGTPK